MSAMDAEEEKPPDPSAFGVYYARLLHQQNMLQDTVRTQTYRHAIVANGVDFDGKIVLDVGSGSGILAFFAAQAGAGRVYAVEASAMAEKAAKLVNASGNAGLARYAPRAEGEKPRSCSALRLPKGAISAEDAWNALDHSLRIHVLKGKVEEVVIPEHVDVIISEPLGFVLVHERMLEAFIMARDRFLRPAGKMFPSRGRIFIAPMTDPGLWKEQSNKAKFWSSPDFYGVDLRPLEEDAMAEYFSQAVVGYFSSEDLLCNKPATHDMDFEKVTLSELRDFTIPFEFEVDKTAVMHGFGCWFSVLFDGSTERVTLSTAPEAPGTHWYQCRLLLRHPIAVNATQVLQGTIHFAVNDRLSYDLTIEVGLRGTQIKTTQIIRLDDQMYHYLQSAH